MSALDYPKVNMSDQLYSTTSSSVTYVTVKDCYIFSTGSISLSVSGSGVSVFSGHKLARSIVSFAPKGVTVSVSNATEFKVYSIAY